MNGSQHEFISITGSWINFDGGGHVRAAGFSMKGEPEQIIEAILEEVKKQL
jgi:phosphoesterase RecJ-like protein